MKTAEEIKAQIINFALEAITRHDELAETNTSGKIFQLDINKWGTIDDLFNECFENNFSSPTVTDEEIDRRAEKFADDWEELGYSRENAYDYFKSGAKWMQSRLSQPVTGYSDSKFEVDKLPDYFSNVRKGVDYVGKKFIVSEPQGDVAEIIYLGENEWRFIIDNFPLSRKFYSYNFPIRSINQFVDDLKRLGISLKSKPNTNTEE